MVNITNKNNSLRRAIASATLKVSKAATIDAVINKQVPKGDVFEFARAAGLLAIKNTSQVIPDCHPLPIEFASIQYDINDLEIIITIEVHTIYKTGVEVEAMHGAAITALTMYDMLKPIDKQIEIQHVKLLSKSGGKSENIDLMNENFKCAVIVCSDSVANGSKQDSSGRTIIEKLKQHTISTDLYEVIPDEKNIIQEKARQLSSEKYNLALFCGGTGLSPRDVTPESILPLLDREIPGIMEAARNYGQQRTPFAMLSRGVAGFIGQTLVITMPGSTSGAAETMDALFPYVLHIFRVAEGMRHSDV